MNFTVDFFKDEVRNGFYIPTAIKQGWAAGLVVLDEIDRICKKHNIEYFADWGTFLGAVRHGGFVPWDDDLDICMKREDYNKFRAVADLELPKNFVIHDYERKEEHQLFLARIVNSNQICFDEAHLNRYHNFPYMASVDIFILDYLYKDEDKERERCDEVKRIIAIADGILEEKLYKETIERELNHFEKKYNVKFDRTLDKRQMMILLYKLAEKQMARVPENEADRIGQIFPWVLKGGKGFPKKYYINPIYLPFENTTIPVPAYYNEALANHYGNYLVCRKVWGGHDYPYFEKQRENLQAVADFKLPEFTFSKDMLVRPEISETYADSLKGMAKECIKQLKDMTEQIEGSCSKTKYLNAEDFSIVFETGELIEEITDILQECQQLAVDLGTLIEKVKGEESESARLVVEKIQVYCDALFELYNLLVYEVISEEDISECGISVDDHDGFTGARVNNYEKISDRVDNIKESLNSLSDMVNERIINRNEIVFLAAGPDEWKGFAPIYSSFISENKADVYVVPIPVLFKNYFGEIIAGDDEIIENTHLEDYPKDVKISLWTRFDIGLHHPDRIYIQNPYDGENPCLTVPPQYYSKELRNYTEELIYVQPFKTGEYKERDYTDLATLKYYVTVPGVVYADKVLVQSENIKEQYIKKLIEFAGEETRSVWESKIEVEKKFEYNKYLNTESYITNEDTTMSSDCDNKRKDNRKKIFYLIGLNELPEHSDSHIDENINKNDSDSESVRTNIIDSIRKRLDIFRENEDDVDVTIGFYPPDISIWNKVDSRLTKELVDLLSSYGHEYILLEPEYYKLEKITEEYDAYYGSPSPLVTIFSYKKKQVMIADYDVNRDKAYTGKYE